MRSATRNSITGLLTAAALGLAAAGSTVPAEAAIHHGGYHGGGYGHGYAGRGGYDHRFAYRGGYRHGYGYYGYGGPGWAYGSYYCGPFPFSLAVNPWACL